MIFKKTLPVLLTATLSISSFSLLAATNDSPPAQQQKDQVPDSTKNGNYLESQPDNNGATDSTTQKKSKGNKANNLEKSKKVKEDPQNGGVDVK